MGKGKGGGGERGGGGYLSRSAVLVAGCQPGEHADEGRGTLL